MTGLFCPLCGGDMEGNLFFYGNICDTCGYIIRADGTPDYSCMDSLLYNEHFSERPENMKLKSPLWGI